jgi:hypothetical protein
MANLKLVANAGRQSKMMSKRDCSPPPPPIPLMDRAMNPPSAPPSDAENDALEHLLRRSMRALDDQVPAAYFDALPAAIDARIDARSTAEIEAGLGVAPVPGAAAVAARAKRRSVAQTQLGAPLPWWHSRIAVTVIGAVAVAGAVALLSGRGGPAAGRRSAQTMSAATIADLRNPERPGVSGGDVEPSGVGEVARLRDRFIAFLPAARGCVGVRSPGDRVMLDVAISPSGAIDVAPRGLAAPATGCVIDILRRADVRPWPRAEVKLELPLFE